MQVIQQEKSVVSKDTISRARQRFSTVRIGASYTYPFLSSALFSITPVPVTGLRHKAGVWAMDKYGRVYFDPETILGECEHDFVIENNIAIFIHEAWHFLRKHPERWEAVWAEYKGRVKERLEKAGYRLAEGQEEQLKRATFKRWNIAADAEINGGDDYIRKNMPDFGVLPEKLKGGGVNWPSDKPLPLNKTAEEYFHWLEPELEEEEEEGREPPWRRGDNPTDDLSEGDWQLPPPEEEDGQGLDEDDADSIRDAVAREILKSSQIRGDIPGSWKKWAGEQLEGPKVPWQQILSQFIRHALEITSGSSDYTYRRRSRRQSVMSGGAILPATYRPKLEVAVVIDTSGSMSDGDLTSVLTEVDGVLKVVGASARVICADTRITAAKRITSASQIECAGRGGTDLRKAIVEAAKGGDGCSKPNAVLIFTDGYTPWPYRDDMRGVPVFTGLVGNNCGTGGVPGWMESLVLED